MENMNTCFSEVIVITLSALALSVSSAYAQEAGDVIQGTAEYMIVAGDVRDGSVIVIKDGETRLSDAPYDPDIYGSVNFRPAIAISQVGSQGAYPIVTSGSGHVLVNTEGGAIKAGDYLTSSSQAGVAMKATQVGNVLGIAKASFSEENGQTGLIPITISVGYRASNQSDPLSPRSFIVQAQDVFTVGVRAAASEPNTALRYAAAVIVLIVSIAFGFLVFGRAATYGVMAVGRNPLARISIMAVTAINITLTVVFAGVGLVLAFLILTL